MIFLKFYLITLNIKSETCTSKLNSKARKKNWNNNMGTESQVNIMTLFQKRYLQGVVEPQKRRHLGGEDDIMQTFLLQQRHL